MIDILHEHLGPVMVFSVAFFSHVQFIALCFPQEHVAFVAHTHSDERPQQVVGLTILKIDWIVLKVDVNLVKVEY